MALKLTPLDAPTTSKLKLTPVTGGGTGLKLTPIDEPSIPERVGSFFEGIGQGFERFKQRSQPQQPLASGESVIRQAPNIIGQLRSIPLEQAAPLTSLAHQYIPPPLNIPAAGIAAPLDAITGAVRTGTELFAGAMGEDKALSPGARIQRGFAEDRFVANRVIKGEAKRLGPELDKALAEGQDPEILANLLTARLATVGTAIDIAEGYAIQGAFDKVAGAIRGMHRAKRLDSAKATRALQVIDRGQRDMLKLAGDPNLPRLPAPADVERRVVRGPKGEPVVIGGVQKKPAQPAQAETAGVGFIKETEGFPFKTQKAVGIEDIIEGPLPKRTVPSATSRAVKLSQAAEEPMRQRVKAGAIQAANVGSEQFPFLPAPKAPIASPLPENVPLPKAGKGFIVEPGGEPIPTVKKADVREDIIEKPIRQGPARVATQREIELQRAATGKIPQKFKSTEEAVEFGKTIRDNPEIRAKLQKLRAQKLKEAAEVRKIADPTDADLQRGIDLGVEAQYYREALQATKKPKGLGNKGEVPSPFQRPEGPQGGPKGESPVARRARLKIEAAQAAKTGTNLGKMVDMKEAVRIKRPKAKGKGTEEVDITGDIEIELPTFVEEKDAAGRTIQKMVGGTKVGNTNVGKLVQDGEITERMAKVLVAAQKANPIIGGKFMETTRAERIAAIGSPSVRDVLKVVESAHPKELAALHDTPVSQALAIAKRAMDEGRPIAQVMDDISSELLIARKVANILGQNLQAIHRSAARGELANILEGHLKKKGLTKSEEDALREALKLIGSPKSKTKLRRTLDMITEYGINAMLSSPVTFTRNLVGSAAGVSSQIPVKIAQATVSNIADLLRIPQTERVYFREIGPEIAGMVKGFVSGFRKGGRFLKYENIKNVFESIERRIARTKAMHIPKGQSFSQLKRDQKARVLRELREDLRDLLTEEEVTRAAELGFTTPTRAIPGKLGEVINIPVRGLVATDKIFQTASASGHVAARRIRKAIQNNEPVENIRLTLDEIEEAKNDAMFYVFREKLGPKLAAIQNVISETPLLPLIIPFFKSRVNFVKYGLKNSPFGFVDTIIKSVQAKALDTKAAARALSGTATLFGIHKFFEKNKDTVELHPSSSSQAERELRRESGIGEQVMVFGTDLQDPKKRKVTHTEPYANLAPFSGPLEVEALVQEYYRRKKKGERIDEALAKTINKGMRGILNQSAFGSIKDSVQAAENMADATVALDANGKPEKGFIESLLTGPAAQVVHRKIAGVAVPNFVRDITKIFDDRILDPKSLSERLRSDLPIAGLKKDIPARQTIFGEEARRQQKRLPFTPFGDDKIDHTMEEMIRLEIFPAKAPKQLAEDKLKIILTEDEQRRFNSLGKELKQNMDDIISQDWYKDADDFTRATVLEKIVDAFRETQTKLIKAEGLLRLIQSEEGIQQMMTGVTKGRSFTPFETSP